MRIAQIAPLQVAVPPPTYGGTERVIANLTDALVRLGHEVTLFATGDSRTSATLVAPRPMGINFDDSVDVVAQHRALLTAVYDQAEQFEVIHSHLDSLTLPFARHCPTPTVHTLHGRLDLDECARVFGLYPEATYVAISDSQRQYLPELNWAATIHHGVNVDSFPYSDQPGTYLVFVGRIAPEKGPERAIRIARQAGLPLKIAAKVDPKDQAYYEQVVKPLLADPLIAFLGPVDEQAKRELMRDALALLLPITWPEPFGMVYIEALACGTPVLTCPHGAAPEILCDGVTGFLRLTDADLATAAHQVATLSREACRAYVRRRFDVRAMALGYMRVYTRAIEAASAHAAQPYSTQANRIAPGAQSLMGD
jgi:glycosyltransferase involved in cell wall biosynthesis